MAQPQAYNRETDFTERDGDDTNHAGINTELDAAALSINQLRDNLALIQRDDGALKNGIVTAESLSDSAFNAVLGEVATATAAASASADRSTLFATQAEADRIAAQAAAAAAQSSQTAAANSATTASAKADESASSATSAATSASTATTKASEASTSATNAANSATASAGSASTASTQATNAAASATASATSATNSANSATTATTQAGIATTQASNAAESATAASASFDEFDDRYLGSKTVDPTTDNDGNALLTGALYFNSVAGEMRVWAGTFWKATGSSVGGTINTAKYTATAGQTTFAIVYDVGFVHVYLNGVKLESGVEFTANNGTSVVLATGATAGDVVDMIAFGIFSVANTYTKAELNAATGASLVGFIQPGAGAVQRTIESKLRDRVSVFDFMTSAQVMNIYLRVGTIDVAAEINNAITAVHAAGGGDLEFPSGRYKTSTSIIPKAGVTLKGLGVPSRVNAATSAVRIDHYGNNPGILLQTPTSVSDIAVENIEFDGLNSGAFASGLTMDAQTNGGAIYGLRFRNCVFANFTNYQALQNGTVFDISFEGCTFHNYGRAAGDCYHVGPNGVPGQQNFINCFFINCTSSSWAFRAEAACDPRFIGGTIGPSHAGANGISALGALHVFGTHIEGYTGSTAIGIAYRGSTGAFIAPSECHAFALGVQIGDGTATTARGWTIAGGVGGNSYKDVAITAGGERDGTITQLSYIGGSYSVLDERLSVDGVAEVFRADGLNSTVIHGAFTPTLTGGSTPGTTTYTVQKGSYCLQGKVCTFVAWIGWSAATGTGQAIVGGLPFNSLADTYTPITSFRYENFAIGANNSLQAYLGAISKTFGIETVSTAGGGAGTLAIPASGSLMITGSYIVG